MVNTVSRSSSSTKRNFLSFPGLWTPTAPGATRPARIMCISTMGGTLPTGDPGHDTFGLQRATVIGANDTENLQHDHADLMSRLSVAPLPSPANPYPRPGSLESQGARDLLLCAVQRSGDCFKRACITDPAGTAELKTFLGQAEVRESSTWRALFGVKRVPRGVVARIARRCNATLHATSQYHGYVSLKHFKAEIRCMKRWYRPGRKIDKRRVGIQ